MNNYNIMFICHKHVSKAVAVLQVSNMSDVRATLVVSIMPASWEVVCRWASHPVSSITSGFLNTITRQRHLHNHGNEVIGYTYKKTKLEIIHNNTKSKTGTSKLYRHLNPSHNQTHMNHNITHSNRCQQQHPNIQSTSKHPYWPQCKH